MLRLGSRDRSPGESFRGPNPKSKYGKCIGRVSTSPKADVVC